MNDFVNKLDLVSIENKPYKIGRLKQSVIDELKLCICETDILIWGDRISYIEKHRGDFETESAYKKHVEALPEIINHPDYVCVHPNGKSLEYIKKLDEWMLVAVRIRLEGALVVRSGYPIKQQKLDSYIASGRAKKVRELDKIE